MTTKQRLKNGHLWLILIIGIVVLLGVIASLTAVIPSPTSGLLVYDKGEWHALKSPAPRAPLQVSVSRFDPVWVVTEQGLYRADRFYEGQLWRFYQIQEGDTLTRIADKFDMTTTSLQSNIQGVQDNDDLVVGQFLWIPRAEHIHPLDDHAPTIGTRFMAIDSTAWAASDTALLYYNGQEWNKSEAWGSFPLLGLTTTGSAHWYLDSGYQLVRFDLAEAQTYFLAEMGFADVAPTDGAPPTLAALPHGPVFVIGAYLLRVDDAGPSRHLTDAGRLQFIGVADGELWLLVDGVLQASPDGEVWRTVALPDPALSYSALTIDKEQRTWLAAENGIWMQPPDGAWQQVYRSDTPIAHITLGNYGQLWAITSAAPRPSLLLTVAILMGVGVLTLGLLAILGVLITRSVVGDARRMRQVLEEKVPDLAPSATLGPWEQGWRKWVLTLTPLALYLALLVGLLLTIGLAGFEAFGERVEEFAETLWPDAPAWLPAVLYDVLVSAVLFLLGVPFALWAIWRTPDTDKRQRLRRNVLAGGVVLFVYPLFNNFLEYGLESVLDGGGLLFVAVCGVLILLGLIAAFVTMGGILATAKDVQRGRYDKIIAKAAQISQRKLVPAQASWVSGTSLMMIGRYAEAEPLLRRSIADGEKDPIFKTNLYSALENLGQTLTGLGRYAEAVAPLQASIELRPHGSWAYVRLAENSLFQGEDAEQALELLATGERNKQRAGMLRLADRFIFSEIAADRALALALLGRHLEVDAEIEAALKQLPKRYQPVEGGVYWRLGEAMRLRKDRRQAQAYWERSLAIDPDGPFSERARAGLAALRGSW